MRFLVCLFACLFGLVPNESLAGGGIQNDYPHLTNWDTPIKTRPFRTGEMIEKSRCSLKPEEAEWLEARIAEGSIRVATDDDLNAWEQKAKQNEGQRVADLRADCGRTFVILKEIPGAEGLWRTLRFSAWTAFIVPEDVPFFRYRAGVHKLDMKTGGFYVGGECYIGNRWGAADRETGECEFMSQDN